MKSIKNTIKLKEHKIKIITHLLDKTKIQEVHIP